jgi:uncharacterized protein (DUF362 family)
MNVGNPTLMFKGLKIVHQVLKQSFNIRITKLKNHDYPFTNHSIKNFLWMGKNTLTRA